jgi:hypothetical protein
MEKVQPCSLDGRPTLLATEDGGLPCVPAGDILTMAGREMSNFYYIIGPTFVFRSAQATEALYLMYYANPDVSVDTRETWVTQQYADMVKDCAKYMYLLTRNEAEKANAFKILYNEQLTVLFSEQGSKQ